MYRLLPVKSWIPLIWGVMIGVALNFRPLMPVDETRYTAVAWEMWRDRQFLVPHLNGELYSHKPPLLFWLMQLTWLAAGVNDWTPRLVSPLFALGTVYLTFANARLLWPDRPAAAEISPIMLLGSVFWIAFGTLTMFDMMLAFFASLAINGLLRLAFLDLSFRRWLWLGVAIGGGVLSKGPVILLHLLPVALAAPWWQPETRPGRYWRHWYGGLLSSVLIGAAIALCWAIPAGIAGGETYRNAIFWGQTQGRLVESFAHKLPVWWYLQFLPLLLLPWLLLKPLWTGIKTLNLQEPGLRFCAAWGVPLFIAFSLISGKRIHYLLPMFPLLILILARAADAARGQTGWQSAHRGLAGLIVLTGIALAAVPALTVPALKSIDLSDLSPAWGLLLSAFGLAYWNYRPAGLNDTVLTVSIATVTLLLTVTTAFFTAESARYDTRQTAAEIANRMDAGHEVVYLFSVHHGEYIFTGRLQKPLIVLRSFKELEKWTAEHANAFVLIHFKNPNDLPVNFPYYRHRYKGQYVALIPADALAKDPDIKKIVVL